MAGHELPYEMLGADWIIPDPGDGNRIPITKSGIVEIVSGASGETNTLDTPTKAGIFLWIHMRTHGGGDRVITADAAIDVAGNTEMTFDAVRDNVLLVSVRVGSTFRWEVLAANNVTPA